jgi:hypothetical protein
LRYSPGDPRWAPAIRLQGRFVNLTVQHSFAVRVDQFFANAGHIETLTLNANTVQQCSGNCYSLGSGAHMVLQNSVFLRDLSTRLFLYGTTDIIVGDLQGSNSILNNDFNTRGEYQGGPDGCALDFELAANGFVVHGNTFYKSFGAAIMIMGHDATSQNLSIVENVFAYSGCLQPRDDRGSIAVTCPNGHLPSATVSENVFLTCSGEPPIHSRVKGCDANVVLQNNSVNTLTMLDMPQISFNPPPPSCDAASGTLDVVCVGPPGAAVRYTLDGSKPTIESLLCSGHIKLDWPGPAVILNVRAFQQGMVASVTNGVIVELNYGLGRMAPHIGRTLEGNLDVVYSSYSGRVHVRGWVLDLLKDGPVTIEISVNYIPVASTLANGLRPDLRPMFPTAQHGFDYELPINVSKLLQQGRHVVSVRAIGTPSAARPTRLSYRSDWMVCDGDPCDAASSATTSEAR